MEQRQKLGAPPDPLAELPFDPALLDFTPVPVRRRRDGWTPERQREFVLELARCGHGSRAAARLGMTSQGLARLLRRLGAEGFARAVAAAYRIAGERRRALARALRR